MNSFSVRLKRANGVLYALETLVSVILKKYILFLFINIGIIIFVSVILKKMEIIFSHIYLRCCKIPKEYSSNSSNISD